MIALNVGSSLQEQQIRPTQYSKSKIFAGKKIFVRRHKDTANQSSVQGGTHLVSVLKITNIETKKTLEKITAAIRVVKLGDMDQHMPFIPFEDFLQTKNKSFLYGRSRCRKSRSIIELIRPRIDDFETIYVNKFTGHRREKNN